MHAGCAGGGHRCLVGDPVKRELVRREPWPARIETSNLKALRREVGRAMEAGELAAVGPVRQWEDGRYSVEVLRLKDRTVERRWVKPAAVAGGAVTVLGGLAAVGWWVATVTLATISALSLPLLVGSAAVLLVAWLVLRKGSRPSGGCETTVTFHHRHR